MKYYLCEEFNMMATTDDSCDECPICHNHPAIEIDELMAPLIHRLIRQNYNTQFSCSSHFNITRNTLRVDRVTPYISFKPIFINDYIEFNGKPDEDPFKLIPLNLANFIIPYFNVYNSTADDIKSYRVERELNPDWIQLMFLSINMGMDIRKLGEFDRVYYEDINTKLALTWSFEANYDFFWDKEKQIVGYRPTIYFRCKEAIEQIDKFNSSRMHYRYFSDLCAIFDVIEYTIYRYMGDSLISEYRYIPEIVDLEDLEYMRYAASFSELFKYNAITDDEVVESEADS